MTGPKFHHETAGTAEPHSWFNRLDRCPAGVGEPSTLLLGAAVQ